MPLILLQNWRINRMRSSQTIRSRSCQTPVRLIVSFRPAAPTARPLQRHETPEDAKLYVSIMSDTCHTNRIVLCCSSCCKAGTATRSAGGCSAVSLVSDTCQTSRLSPTMSDTCQANYIVFDCSSCCQAGTAAGSARRCQAVRLEFAAHDDQRSAAHCLLTLRRGEFRPSYLRPERTGPRLPLLPVVLKEWSQKSKLKLERLHATSTVDCQEPKAGQRYLPSTAI